jgi:hypothetical protein
MVGRTKALGTDAGLSRCVNGKHLTIAFGDNDPKLGQRMLIDPGKVAHSYVKRVPRTIIRVHTLVRVERGNWIEFVGPWNQRKLKTFLEFLWHIEVCICGLKVVLLYCLEVNAHLIISTGRAESQLLLLIVMLSYLLHQLL